MLEEGFLTSPAFMDREFAKTDIRSRIPWTDPEKKEGLRKAFEIWKPLCEEYHCSFATLVEAWALSMYVGSSKDNSGCGFGQIEN